MTGSLTVVGTGIQAQEHTTLGACRAIRDADIVLFAVADRPAADWIRSLNSKAESFEYDTTEPRRRPVYQKMIERMLREVRDGKHVCAVFYGHPGVFAHASHAAIRQAKKEGFRATMLPGVSAEDCLLADMGVDPASLGCQSYEATDFLIRPRAYDSSTALILWQIGVIGNMGFWSETADVASGLAILGEVLCRRYSPDHRVYLYEASTDGSRPPRIEPTALDRLSSVHVTAISTLFVPAMKAAARDAQMMARLGVRFPSSGGGDASACDPERSAP